MTKLSTDRGGRQGPPKKIVSLPWHAHADLLLQVGRPPLLLLVGEPACGKTTYARHAAMRLTGRPPVVLSGTPETELSHLFGRWTLAGEETRFCDGPLPRALKSGLTFLLEEFSQIPLECRSALLPLRDQDEITNPFNEEVLSVPKHWRLIATSNSETLTCRKNSGIARVLYDGFLVLEVPDLDERQVACLLRHHFPNAGEARLARVQELWSEYRGLSCNGESGKGHLSYRAAEHLTALLECGMPETRAVQIALVNKFLTSDPDLFSVASIKNSLADPSDGAAPGGPAGREAS